MSTIDAIKGRFSLRDIAQSLRITLPDRNGVKFRSPFRSDKTPSCTIYQRGDEERYRDWSAGIDVDCIGFYAIARGISNKEAIRELSGEIGIFPDVKFSLPQPYPPSKPSIPTKPSHGIADMPNSVAQAWNKGVDALRADSATRQRIASWRGWSPEVVGTLAEDGQMGLPDYYRQRLVAFRVDAPLSQNLGVYGSWFSTIQIGWHVRLKSPKGEKAPWRFMPSQREHGISCPALPFILGDFSTAKLLVITEGQWDCISLAHAAGWLAHDAAWPDSICCLGIRGVEGVNAFLRAYDSHWPPNPKCLLLPDADAAGRRWFEPPSSETKPFCDALAERCAQVRVETLTGAKDFNEAWKRRLICSADIAALMIEAGFTNQKGVVR